MGNTMDLDDGVFGYRELGKWNYIGAGTALSFCVPWGPDPDWAQGLEPVLSEGQCKSELTI